MFGWPVKAISKVLPRHSQFEQQLDSWQQHIPPICTIHDAFQHPPHVAFGDAPSELQQLVLTSIAQHCWLSFHFVFGDFGGFLGLAKVLLCSKALYKANVSLNKFFQST